jgi:Protein of unknown function (DUF3106)
MICRCSKTLTRIRNQTSRGGSHERVVPGIKMRARTKITKWIATCTLSVLAMVPALAQKQHNDTRPVPRPNQSQQRESRPGLRQQPRSEAPPRPQPQFQPAPQPERQYQAPRPYQPPEQGHHSGQWLNQHRNLPLEQQKRALQNDPQFKRLTPDRQQKFEQRLQRFDSLPADRQQQVLRRMETWEHLTPQQKQQFRSFDSQYKSLAPERRQAVRNAIETLRAMPPQARQQEIESGRFSQFSPQERQVLNDAARLPLAPSQSTAPQSGPTNSDPERYVPRPPQ